MNIEEKLDKLEALLVVLVRRQAVKDWYSTDEFAQLVGKAEFTGARVVATAGSKRRSGCRAEGRTRPGRSATTSTCVTSGKGCSPAAGKVGSAAAHLSRPAE